MGCGASKSSKVALDVIGTKPQTAAPVDGNNGDVSSGDCQRVPPVYISAEPQTAEIQEGTDHPDQSAESNDRHNCTVVRDSIPDRHSTETVILAHNISRDQTMLGVVGGGAMEGEGQGPTDEPKMHAPVAFEVDMRPDGLAPRKTLPPRRLTSLESAPQMTTDMLLEKQRQVEQRRAQELERRKSSGLPMGKEKKDKKKNKLMKDIMAAIEMQACKEEADYKLSSSDSYGSEKLPEVTHIMKASHSKDDEMEVDDNFNAASSDEL